MRVTAFLQVKRAIQLRNIVTSLGPAYIKVGRTSSPGRHACCVCELYPG